MLSFFRGFILPLSFEFSFHSQSRNVFLARSLHYLIVPFFLLSLLLPIFPSLSLFFLSPFLLFTVFCLFSHNRTSYYYKIIFVLVIDFHFRFYCITSCLITQIDFPFNAKIQQQQQEKIWKLAKWYAITNACRNTFKLILTLQMPFMTLIIWIYKSMQLYAIVQSQYDTTDIRLLDKMSSHEQSHHITMFERIPILFDIFSLKFKMKINKIKVRWAHEEKDWISHKINKHLNQM